MTETLELGEVVIELTRKAVKNIHLSVHPPLGSVRLVVPADTRPEVARAYVISKLGWIRERQAEFAGQSRELPRQFVSRESHYLWGKQYLLVVEYQQAKPSVSLDHRRITLRVRPGSSRTIRGTVMHQWHKACLHQASPLLSAKWEPRLGVRVAGYFLQRMKTKWGSCNPRAGNIRLNTELVKKPKDLLEYVVVHEMMHLLEPTHNERFISLMNQHYPAWREARAELNELPLGS